MSNTFTNKFKRMGAVSIYPPIDTYNFKDIKNIWERNLNLPKNISNGQANIYVHIPFCPKKCGFCYYNSFQANKSTLSKYVKHLEKEIEIASEISWVKSLKFHTIYFGGGTPTFLSNDMLDSLLEKITSCLTIANDAQITLEVRPGNEVTNSKLKCLKRHNVNRISIGAQSFNQDILNRNKRHHKVGKFYEIFYLLRESGFNNINIDIMSGMLFETMETWQETIDAVFKLRPENITCFKMHIYKNSIHYKDNINKNKLIGKVKDIDEIKMIKLLLDKVYEEGYDIYDVECTFTKSVEYINKHQLYLQKGNQFLGLGLSANAFMNQSVYQNTQYLDEYYDMINSNNLPIKRSYTMDLGTMMKRVIVYGIRRTIIDIKDFIYRFNVNPIDIIIEQYPCLFDEGILYLDDNYIRVNKDLRIFTDDIVRTYIFSEEERYWEEILSSYKNIKFSNSQ